MNNQRKYYVLVLQGNDFHPYYFNTQKEAIRFIDEKRKDKDPKKEYEMGQFPKPERVVN